MILKTLLYIVCIYILYPQQHSIARDQNQSRAMCCVPITTSLSPAPIAMKTEEVLSVTLR